MPSRQTIEQDSSHIDLTPMLDVVFIMLIFFIVTASFIREQSLDVDRPEPSSMPQTEPHKNIKVTLTPDNQIMLDRRRIDHRSLRAYFERHLAANPEAALIIDAHNRSKTYAVVQITDAARQAGLFQIILANVESQ